MHFRFIQATYILFVEAELARRMRAWRPDILSIYERSRDVFEEVGLLEDSAKVLSVVNEALIVVEEFAKAYWRYVGASTIEIIYDELRSLLEGRDP